MALFVDAGFVVFKYFCPQSVYSVTDYLHSGTPQFRFYRIYQYITFTLDNWFTLMSCDSPVSELIPIINNYNFNE